MDRPDGGDHGDVRRAPSAQLGDLTGPVGAHLGDEHLGTVGQVLVDRPGQAGAVVEAGRGGHHRPGGAHQVGDVALGRGLAVGAGDAHHRRMDPGQAGAGLVDEAVRQSALDRGGDQAGHVHQEGDGHRGQGGDRGRRSEHRADGHQHQLERRPHQGQGPQAPGPGQRRGPAPQREADGPGRHPRGGGQSGQRPPTESTRPARTTTARAGFKGVTRHQRTANRDADPGR